MVHGLRPRSFAIAFWQALAGAIVVLLVLALLNQRLSTGWRLYVLARALRAVWAATIAMIAGTGAGLLLDAMIPARRGGGFSIQRILFAALKPLIVVITALGTLGYFMPDWTPLSAICAALTLSIWLLAGALALTL